MCAVETLAGSNAAPAVSGEHAPNVPRSGGGSVTIAGLHFGPQNLTPTASLEDSDDAACTTSSWTSVTTVACNARSLKGSRVREAMTVAGVVGTGFSFSFDGTVAAQSLSGFVGAGPFFSICGWSAAPIVSFTDRWNIGRTGDGSVTISGLQFGLVGLSPTASLEDSTWDSTNHPCSCTSWTTGTAVVCNARASRAGLVREVVTVGGAVGTRTQTFTFDGTMHSIG